MDDLRDVAESREQKNVAHRGPCRNGQFIIGPPRRGFSKTESEARSIGVNVYLMLQKPRGIG